MFLVIQLIVLLVVSPFHIFGCKEQQTQPDLHGVSEYILICFLLLPAPRLFCVAIRVMCPDRSSQTEDIRATKAEPLFPLRHRAQNCNLHTVHYCSALPRACIIPHACSMCTPMRVPHSILLHPSAPSMDWQSLCELRGQTPWNCGFPVAYLSGVSNTPWN